MALHPEFPASPHVILNPDVRWFPADEALRESSYDKLIPPLVHQLRRLVHQWRADRYSGASDTSRALLNWWFNTQHLIPTADGTMTEFRYYFAQREAVESIIYLYDLVGVKDLATKAPAASMTTLLGDALSSLGQKLPILNPLTGTSAKTLALAPADAPTVSEMQAAIDTVIIPELKTIVSRLAKVEGSGYTFTRSAAL